MRSVMERMFFDSGPSPVSIAFTVAVTAPQRVCPMTTTRRESNCDAANSIDPTTDGATMLPAMRTTNRSPKPSSNRISTGVRESEQPSTIANGRCACVDISRLHARAMLVPFASRNRRLPAIRRLSASSGASGAEEGGSVSGIGGRLYHARDFRAAVQTSGAGGISASGGSHGQVFGDELVGELAHRAGGDGATALHQAE